MIDPIETAKSIIEIGKQCCNYNVNEVIISSITAKKSLKLTSIIREINDAVESFCETENFYFIRNDDITIEHLEEDGVHLNDSGTDILAGNFVDYFNNYILDMSY